MKQLNNQQPGDRVLNPLDNMALDLEEHRKSYHTLKDSLHQQSNIIANNLSQSAFLVFVFLVTTGSLLESVLQGEKHHVAFLHFINNKLQDLNTPIISLGSVCLVMLVRQFIQAYSEQGQQIKLLHNLHDQLCSNDNHPDRISELNIVTSCKPS